MLECKNLNKEFKIYRKKPGIMESLKGFVNRDYVINHAVKDFNLKIDTPQLIGLLGPNGSGKTTLMKMFTGIITNSSGSVKVLDCNPIDRKNYFKKNISLVMGQKSQLWWDIPVMDSLLLFQRYYEIEESKFQKRLKDLGERLDVMHLLHVPVRKLSLGERMKAELMACLMHEPKVIFLDEPTIGLDLVSQKNVRQFLKDYYKDKKPLIVLTSHYMADVEALCERIVLITKGEKRFDGSIENFKNIFEKEKTIIFSFNEPIKLEKQKSLESLYHCEWDKDGYQVNLRVSEDKINQTAIKILNEYPVSDFQTAKVSIEEVMDEVLSNPAILSKLNFNKN